MFKLFNKNKYSITLLMLFVSVSYFNFTQKSVAETSSGQTNVNLLVEGCNNNNICELINGENNATCSNDCTPCNYNNVCELLKGETPMSCPLDCQVVSTTTPDNFAPSNSPVPASGSILNSNINVGINYAIISWDTIVPTYGSVSWGVGEGYNDGIINSHKITTHHEIVIENLLANTKYSFFINSSLPQYYYAKKLGTFTTLLIPEIKIIPSIYDLITQTTNDSVILSWNNPDSSDFYGVRIVRSPFFYPTDPLGGKIIYDGNGTYVRDADVLLDQKYYYTAFSYDKDFNFSAGPVVETIIKSQLATSTQGARTETGELINFPINNFMFMEDNSQLTLSSSTITSHTLGNLKIIIDVNKFSNKIKTLVMKIEDSSDLSHSFYYSFNLDSTNNIFYLNLPSFKIENNYPFTIQAYDSANQAIYITEGLFTIKVAQGTKPTSILESIISSFSGKLTMFYSGIIVTITLFIFTLYKLFGIKR